MKERIQRILYETGLTATKLADELDVQRSGISHILSGRNQPSYDFLVRLLNRFNDINADWLITGKGEMYKPKPPVNKQADLFQPGISQPEVEQQKKQQKEPAVSNVTNVNIKRIIVLRSDGTFELYNPSDND